MPTVSVNPPKTPVTAGSTGIAAATVPNVCKMPGPPAPFVPVPLPNIGKSGDSPKDYSTTVKIEGNKVAIKGATFNSMGDMASKALGGGLVSMNTHGPTSFVGPGSMDVKIEGKNVQLLSDPMLNNNGPSGNPPNAATMLGVLQMTGVTAVLGDECPLCNKAPHEPLKETKETKADAGNLAQNYDTRREKLSPNNSNYKRPTMLGVVYCKCPKKYAAQSGVISQLLCDAAKDSGMKHPKGAVDIQERIKAHAGNDKVVEKAWQETETLSCWSQKNPDKPAAYPPGACAAQQALVLTLDDGGLPSALTEEWYHPKKQKTRSPIRYIDATNPKGGWVVKDKEFEHGSTVPPCGTCEIILPLLLCSSEEDRCSH
jgi:hypothetical protein